MRQVRFVTLMLMVLVVLSGCRRRQPEQPAPMTPPPPPPPAATTDPDAERRAREEEERRREAERRRNVLTEMVFFAFDRYDLSPEAQAILNRKVQILRDDPTIRLRIDGHCDERGSIEYNLALGMRRAQAVKDYLVGFGIDPDRLAVESFGEDRPLDPRSNEEAWARNRRAEFQIIGGSLMQGE
jgi:peptidoglycan-associated lipoprotein